MIEIRNPQPPRRPNPQPQLPAPHDCSGTCACGVEPLAHPKYSFGMLLEARHLALEHDYAAMRLNTHDIRLHDFGTVCGLRVIEHPSRECVNTYAILQPGIALDCCGREIVVPETLFVPLFDGARSGWCGAPESIPQTPPQDAPRTTLYVYLAYQQCDTDPMPAYVRACGCCEGHCEHGNCVPSVTREGYVVLVSTVAPQPWRNPVGATYCRWLETQLKGPGMFPDGAALARNSLDATLCDVVTAPCADFCANGNDWLLLATLTFDANDALSAIDNCTNRRLVLSTGAIVEAIECLTTAVIACCGDKEAFLNLTGEVTPASVNIEAPPADSTITYSVNVTNADATKDAGALSIDLALPAGVTFANAALTVDGAAQPNPTASGANVSAPVAALAAGKSAQLKVAATFDVAQRHAGDTLTATASVGTYTGPHGADVPLTTTFEDVKVDGPRVVIANLPQSLTAAEALALLRQGIPLPFTEPMNPDSASTGPSAQSAFLEVVRGTAVTELQPLNATWSNGNTLLTLAYVASTTTGTTGTHLASFGGAPEATTGGNEPPVLRIRLLGGPKGPSTASGPALQGADGMRLDGSPPQGGPPGQVAGQSGDGNQGGDFQWDITITFPAVDGPHVNRKASKVPAQMPFGAAAKTFAPNGPGINILFDAPMNTDLPPSGQVNTSIITLQVKNAQVPVVAKWTNATTLNLNGAQPQMELAIRTLVQTGGTIAFTLAGGPKGTAPPGTLALQSADGRRLDGAPPNGTGQLAADGLSGDGTQGGDYVQTITVTGG